jgi:cytochrome c553
MSRALVAIVFSVLAVPWGAAFAAGDAVAGDTVAGKTKAAACAACHGPTGRSANDAWPNLAGQKLPYLVKQLKAFRDGTRTNPLMSPTAKTLSDADVEDLAAWFSSQQVDAIAQ